MHAASTNDYLVSVTKTLSDTGNKHNDCFGSVLMILIKNLHQIICRKTVVKRYNFYIFSNLLEKTTDGIIKAAKVGDLLAVR